MTIQLTPALILIQSKLIEHGIPYGAFAALCCVKDGPKSLTAIRKQISVSDAVMTNLKNKLVKGGYAVRKPCDDQRVFLLEITPKGLLATTICVAVTFTPQEEALKLELHAS